MNTKRPTAEELKKIRATDYSILPSLAAAYRAAADDTVILFTEIDALALENAELRERIEKHGKYEPNEQIMQAANVIEMCAERCAELEAELQSSRDEVKRLTEQLEQERQDHVDDVEILHDRIAELESQLNSRREI